MLTWLMCGMAPTQGGDMRSMVIGSAFALALAAAAGPAPAVAQTGYFQGVTPRPADVFAVPASLTVTRSAPPGGRYGEVIPALYTHVATDPATRSFEWANLSILKNYSDHGSNVAVYGQAHKFGHGTSWAGVFELQDARGDGGFYALEVDAYTTGASHAPGSRAGDRIGLGIILGRAFNAGPKATIDYAVFVAPQALDHREADVNYGMMVYADCRYACYAMRAGNKIAYEESAVIASKYDPHTGRWGLFNGDRPLFEVDVASGELRVNGRAVELRYKE